MYIGPTGYSRISRSAVGGGSMYIEAKKITYKYKYTYNTHIYTSVVKNGGEINNIFTEKQSIYIYTHRTR